MLRFVTKILFWRKKSTFLERDNIEGEERILIKLICPGPQAPVGPQPPPVIPLVGTMNGQGRTKNLDEELREYAIEAKRHPPGSRHRREALTQLMEGILRSGRISRPRKGEFPECYDDIRNEAIQKTALYLCDKIEGYDPDKSPVIRWFNYLLEKRFFKEAIREIVGDKNVFSNDPASFDRLPSKENNPPLLSEELRKYVEEDPEGKLKNRIHKVYKQVNFWDLLRRRMAGEKWKTIAADLGVPASTLSDFYQRNLKEIALEIQRYLKNRG